MRLAYGAHSQTTFASTIAKDQVREFVWSPQQSFWSKEELLKIDGFEKDLVVACDCIWRNFKIPEDDNVPYSVDPLTEAVFPLGPFWLVRLQDTGLPALPVLGTVSMVVKSWTCSSPDISPDLAILRRLYFLLLFFRALLFRFFFVWATIATRLALPFSSCSTLSASICRANLRF